MGDCTRHASIRRLASGDGEDQSSSLYLASQMLSLNVDSQQLAG